MQLNINLYLFQRTSIHDYTNIILYIHIHKINKTFTRGLDKGCEEIDVVKFLEIFGIEFNLCIQRKILIKITQKIGLFRLKITYIIVFV